MGGTLLRLRPEGEPGLEGLHPHGQAASVSLEAVLSSLPVMLTRDFTHKLVVQSTQSSGELVVMDQRWELVEAWGGLGGGGGGLGRSSTQTQLLNPPG